MNEIVKRYSGNPIITIDDIPGTCRSVFNPGVIKFNGQYLLIMTVRGLDNLPKLWIATSKDGYHFTAQKTPLSLPEDETYKKYEFCNYDTRIVKIEDIYYFTYAVSGFLGVRIGIAKTTDFKAFERVSFFSEVGNHNVVLFPRKINNRYVCLDRPQDGSLKNIWISYSPDLIYWGDSKIVMENRPGFWDGSKIGAGPPPIETQKGWLEIYHGVNDIASGPIYQLGCVLLDLNDPSKVIARGRYPILYPKEIYEQIGFIPNVVFSCGAIFEEDTGELKIYYGVCDQCICMATSQVDELIQVCFDR